MGLLILAACETVTTTDPSVLGTIEGTVSVEGGGGLADVEVRLAGPVVDTIVTPSSGSFSFSRVPGGDYSVTIVGGPASVSFEDRVQSASISTQGQSVRVDFEGAYPAVTIQTSSMASAQQNQSYSDTLRSTGGSGTYTWALASGALPSGLSLDTSTGVVSGTPTVVETQAFRAQVASAGDTAHADLSIAVFPDGLQITTTSLSAGQVGAAYSEQLASIGGTGPVSWSIVVGSFPPGLSLTSSSGRIEGVPTDVGTFGFSVQAATATDTASAGLSISVGATGGLVHRWRFDEVGSAGTSVADDVGAADGVLVDEGSNDGQLFGGAAIFTGGSRASSDYVALPAGLLSGLTDATIEVWATPLSVQGSAVIFAVGADTTDQVTMSWTRAGDPDSDVISWAGPSDAVRVEDAMAPYPLGEEQHVVLTFDWDAGAAETTVRWFRNGSAIGSTTMSGSLSELRDSLAYLGRALDPSEPTANASYNEVRIYGEALTSQQVQTSAANPPAGPPPVDWVRLSPDSADVHAGETHSYLVQILDAGGVELPGRYVRWSIDDPDVATVDSVTGLVTGQAPGTTTVTATVDGVADEAMLVILPANLNRWIGGTGKWEVPANWSRNRVPTLGDSAVVDQSDVVVTNDTVTIATSRIGALTVGSLGGATELRVWDGLVVDGATYVADGSLLHVAGSQLTVRGTLVVDGVVDNRKTISLQPISGSPDIVVNGTLRLAYQGSVNSPTGGDGALRIAPAGLLEVDSLGDTEIYLGLPVEVEGTARWLKARVNMGTEVFRVAMGGEFVVDSGNTLWGHLGGRVVVDGLLRREANSATTTFDLPVDLGSSGMIEVQAGTFRALDTLEIRGSVALADTATLVATHVFDFQSTGVLAGGGTMDLSGAAIPFFAGTVRPGGDAGEHLLLRAPPAGVDQLAPSLFELDVATPGNPSDVLEVDGAVTLGGSLVVDTIGTFTATPGDRIPVLVFTSRSGNFSSVTLPVVTGLVFDTLWTSGNAQDTLYVVVN